MKRIVFEFDETRCIGCGACAVACMDQNDIDPRVQAPFRRIRVQEPQENGASGFTCLSLSCMHCPDAPCVSACPTGCLRKDPQTGLTLYDAELCIGCRVCDAVCPFDALSFTSEGKMSKCDGCVTRLENGLAPACVRICPFDALKVRTVESDDQSV